MIIVYGSRFYGRIRQCGSSFLATKFVHIYFVPLIPIGSHLVFEENGDGSYRGVAAPFSFKSVMAGYLRVWGPLAIILTGVLTAGAVDDLSDDPLAMLIAGGFGGLVGLALLAGVILAYAVMGKLSTTEKQQRAVYALHSGYYVDPAELGDARHSLREDLIEKIRARARGLSAMGYRVSADPAQAWPHIAMDPTQNDEAFITAAFTLARLDGSLAQGPYKTHMEQVHAHLWQRISRSNAPYLHAVLQA